MATKAENSQTQASSEAEGDDDRPWTPKPPPTYLVETKFGNVQLVLIGSKAVRIYNARIKDEPFLVNRTAVGVDVSYVRPDDGTIEWGVDPQLANPQRAIRFYQRDKIHQAVGGALYEKVKDAIDEMLAAFTVEYPELFLNAQAIQVYNRMCAMSTDIELRLELIERLNAEHVDLAAELQELLDAGAQLGDEADEEVKEEAEAEEEEADETNADGAPQDANGVPTPEPAPAATPRNLNPNPGKVPAADPPAEPEPAKRKPIGIPVSRPGSKVAAAPPPEPEDQSQEVDGEDGLDAAFGLD